MTNFISIFLCFDIDTLTGLDDYPRAEEPTRSELHVDLQSWMIKSALIMKKLEESIDMKGESYQTDYTNFKTALEGNQQHDY